MKEYKTCMSQDPVELVEKMEGSRLLPVIKALLRGVEVNLGEFCVRLAHSDKGGFCPVFVVGENKDLVQGMPDMSIMWLSNRVAEMTDEEFEKLSFEYTRS